MTKSYTYSEARQNLASVLLQADKDGEVSITHRDGRKYIVKVTRSNRSPLDVPCLGKKISRQEIVDSIREGRESDYQTRSDNYLDDRGIDK